MVEIMAVQLSAIDPGNNFQKKALTMDLLMGAPQDLRRKGDPIEVKN